MRPPSVFVDKRRELESSEFQYGVEAGRLAVALDLLTDSLIMVGQHGVYCQSARQPGTPAMDLQIVLQGLEQSKELVVSVMDELRRQKAGATHQP
ncbi:MAG TPA: hypothetical protein PKJ41_16875 [Bryobacteraceae bacterium]|nr:hypothetical protein [Bryobacteraceae bacterium]